MGEGGVGEGFGEVEGEIFGLGCLFDAGVGDGGGSVLFMLRVLPEKGGLSLV